MNNNLDYRISFSIRPENVFINLNNHINQITSSTQKMTFNFGESWKKLLSMNQAIEGLERLSSMFEGLVQPGATLNSSLADLSAITGLTGKSLEAISEAARSSAIAFGTDAAQNVESYKLILSQLSPEIAQNSVALQAMGNHVNILSKTMGGDTAAATDVLTTAMNQYGVSLDDPMQASETMAEMMNVMAAAAKEGSAELPQIKAALENVGMVAKTTGVSFSETNAAIQVLDKAGKKGAEGGVALRNVLNTLSEGRFLPKQTQDELKAAGVNMSQLADTSLPLTTRLNALKSIMNDSALVTKLFGKENAAAGIALINGSGVIDEYNKKIQDTSTAVDQAKIVMGSYAESLKRSKSCFDDLKIGLFNLNHSFFAWSQNVMTGVGGLAQFVNGISIIKNVGGPLKNMIWDLSKKILIKTGIIQSDTVATTINGVATAKASLATRLWTGVQRVFNTVMGANPIGATIRAITLLVAGIGVAIAAYSAYNKNQDTTKTLSNQLNSQILVEKRGLNDLFDQLKRTNPESTRRKELIDEMNAHYPGLLNYQQLEKANEKEIEKARHDANEELKKTIVLSAQKTQKEAFVKDVTDKEKALADDLFEEGKFHSEKIGSLMSKITTKAESLVESGKFKPGILSGAASYQINDIMREIMAEDPSMKALIKHAPNKVSAYIDALLTGNKQADDYKRFIEMSLGGKPSAQKVQIKEEIKKDLKDDKTKNSLKNLGNRTANDVKNQPDSNNFSSLSSSPGNGGSGSRSLTINKLVETLVVKVERLPESKERIKDAVSEALLLAVNDYNLAT